MMNSNISSIIIHTYLQTPVSLREIFIEDIRKLCNTLEAAEASDMDDISNLLSGDNE